MKSYQELLAEARARIREISVKDAMALKKQNANVVFLDVRDPNEFNLAKIAGAVTISRGFLEGKVEAQVDRDKPIVVYCANGNRSVFATESLEAMGYKDVRSLAAGFNGWVAEGGDVE